ncbi:MAG: hypothetical protein ACREJD_15135 [Phycisphaerales bacterium]
MGRVNKGGRLTKELLQDVIGEPSVVEAKSFSWTIIESGHGTIRAKGHSTKYRWGTLAKFQPGAVVSIVDAKTRRLVEKPEPNLATASSLFVYFPDEEVIAFKHVWNEITAWDFQRRFSEIVKDSLQRFFVECDIILISDERAFVRRIAELVTVEEIKATVAPPNPLFGPLWKPLRDFLRHRRAATLRLKEEAVKGQSLNSALPELAKEALRKESAPKSPSIPLDIPDAAALLATDGYGNAQITGTAKGGQVVIKTSDRVERLKIDADATPAEVAGQVHSRIQIMNKKRGLRH